MDATKPQANQQPAPADSVAILRKLAAPFAYYWSIRWALAEQMRQWARTLRGRRTPQREIRIRPRGSYRTAHRDGRTWHVRLPDCCVVCGGAAQGPIVVHERRDADITWPLLAPQIGLELGLCLSIWLWSLWWIPLLLVPGFAAGYVLRRSVPVHLRVRRCEDHRTVRSIPAIFGFAGSLVVRTGHWEVSQQFWEENGVVAITAAPTPQAATTAAPAKTVPAEASPDTTRAKREAALRQSPWERRLEQFQSLVAQLIAGIIVVVAAVFLFKYALAEYGLTIGALISGSFLYLFFGAAVLRLCSKLFASGTPDYPLALFAVLLAGLVWNGVLWFLRASPPPVLTTYLDTNEMTWQVGALLAGVVITLFGVPALIYVSLLDARWPAATLIFILQHVITILIASGLVWAAYWFVLPVL